MNLSFAGCGFLGIYHVGVAVCFRKYAPHFLLDKISGASFGAISACCLLCDLPLAMNLSFAGCGFLSIYHVGVTSCFRKYAPHLVVNKVSGASAGALSACSLLCDLPIGEITSDVLRVVNEARSGSLGPFSPSFNVQSVLLEGLQKFLPDDAHIRVSGKLHISLTRVYDGKNVIVSQFNSKEDLLQALLASCFIPVFSGLLPPRFHGVRYMDGGFSDNLPILDENTITVSPFCGESDICPRDLSSQLFHVNVANTSIELSKQNINRFARILFPPKPEVLSNMCKQGFDDALRFLHRNNLISCTRCLAVQSTFQLQEALNENIDFDPDCEECKTHREEALVANLPDTVMTVFQNAIDSANKGILNWVFKQRGMKILSVMSIPYRLPADVVYATFTKLTNSGLFSLIGDSFEQHTLQYRVVGNILKFQGGCPHHTNVYTRLMASTPKMSHTIWKLGMALLHQLHGFLYSVNDKSSYSAQMSYEMALSRYHSAAQRREVPQAGDRRHGPPVRRRSSIMRIGIVDPNTIPQPSDDDTFEDILRVSAHNDAILAYYYLDGDNKMKVTEIFDVTDSEMDGVQSPTERDTNKQLEFDNEWDEDMDFDHENGIEISSVISADDELQDRNIFSDPESEWGRPHSPVSIREIEEDLSQPESDQSHKYAIRGDEYVLTHNR